MAVDALMRLAADAPAPIFAVAGEDGLAAVEDLSLDPAVSLQASPRHAALLLVCGDLRSENHEALRRLHDQLPHPRATLWWRTEPRDGFPCAARSGQAPVGKEGVSRCRSRGLEEPLINTKHNTKQERNE